MSRFATSACLAGFLAATTADANSFLQGRSRADGSGITAEDIEDTLLAELNGRRDASKLLRLEQELKPMFYALPKNADGRLDNTAVRYALHRHFSGKHGWLVSGLEPSSQHYVSAMEGLAPGYIQEVFDKRLKGKGMGLRDLSVYAATIMDLIHAEAAGQIERAYDMMDLPTTGPVDPDSSELALHIWLMQYVLGVDLEYIRKEEFDELQPEISNIYPAWEETKLWAHDLELSYGYAQRHRRNPFLRKEASFSDSLALVQEIGHSFGSFQNLECRHVKAGLLEFEDRGTGRVPLSRFYAGSKGGWQFTESAAYLKSLGVLDESDPRRPSVMIANYVNSRSNCMQASSFYTVCCVDECGALLGHVEREIGAPSAEHTRLAEVVASLPSDTVDAPRNLSTALLSRLQDIAAFQHNQRVPLHGRLFAQWMHHAYPRECSFPHVMGTVRQVSPIEYAEEMGDDAVDVSEEDMKMHLVVAELPIEEDAIALPWTATEELLAGGLASSKKGQSPLRALNVMVLGLVAFGLVVGSITPLTKAGATCCLGVGYLDCGKSDRHMV